MQTCTDVDQALRSHLNLEGPNFVQGLLPQLVELVRSSRRLPLGEEHAIRRSSKDFLASSRELGQRSLGAVHRTLCFLDPDTHVGTKPEALANFNQIIDSIDTVLERADACMRQALAEPRDGAAAAAEEAADAPEAGLSKASSSRSAPKPQVRWRQLIDNERTQFVPRLLVKHNQQVALPSQLVEAQSAAGFRLGAHQQGRTSAAAEALGGSGTAEETDADKVLAKHLSSLGVGRREASSALPHPYDHELLTLSWPDSHFRIRPAERFLRMEDTPLVVVRTEQDLREMIEEIKATCTGKEIAVDIEHHDFRSYRGFVCLVQVSTRQKDFIIDPFDIFVQMHMLNEIFTDPNIVKVLHGADRDVQWLQRDFSVYLVNMFDTGLAARSLRLQGGFSLANLVSLICGVKLDKKYQTADWRERPLPAEMLKYARSDTHYLLYCYDCVKNALLCQTAGTRPPLGSAADNLEATEEGVTALQTVLDQSRDLCRTQYVEGPFDAANTAMRICERFGSKLRPLEPRQFGALQALVEWRDRLARNLDESLNYISPDGCLWRIVQAMPTTPAQLRSTCNPLPGAVQQHALEVLDLVAKGKVGGERAAPLSSAATSAPAVTPGVSAGPETSQAAPSSSSTAVAGKAAQPPAGPLRPWPVRSHAGLQPVVHVVAAGRRTNGVSYNGLSAVLGSLADSDDSGAEGAAPREIVDRVEAIRNAIRFASAAPSMPAAVEALLEAAEAEAAAFADMELAVEAYEETCAVLGAVADEAQAEATEALGSQRRRKKRRANEDCLEAVAKASALADPYASAALADPYAELPQAAEPAEPAAGPAETAEATRPKKKKKKAAKPNQDSGLGSALIDPYL